MDKLSISSPKAMLIFGLVAFLLSLGLDFIDIFILDKNEPIYNMTQRAGAVLVIIGLMIDFSKGEHITEKIRIFSKIYALSGTFIWAYADLFFKDKLEYGKAVFLISLILYFYGTYNLSKQNKKSG